MAKRKAKRGPKRTQRKRTTPAKRRHNEERREAPEAPRPQPPPLQSPTMVRERPSLGSYYRAGYLRSGTGDEI